MPSLQTVIVLVIVAGAAFYLIRRFSRNLKKSGEPACGCGCSGCGSAQSCEDNRIQPNIE